MFVIDFTIFITRSALRIFRRCHNINSTDVSGLPLTFFHDFNAIRFILGLRPCARHIFLFFRSFRSVRKTCNLNFHFFFVWLIAFTLITFCFALYIDLLFLNFGRPLVVWHSGRSLKINSQQRALEPFELPVILNRLTLLKLSFL